VQLKVKTTNDDNNEIWNVDDISIISDRGPQGSIVLFN